MKKTIFFLLFISLIAFDLSGQVLQKVPGLSSRFRETNMSITPNGKYLYFMSMRGGMPWSTRRPLAPGDRVAQYDGDIWYAVKVGEGKWSAPRSLSEGINTYSGEDEPNITADGQGVYFQSWRDGWEWTGGPYYRAELNGSQWSRPVGMGSNITQFFKDMDLRLDKVFERDLKAKNLYREYIKLRTIYPFSWAPKLERRGINFNDYVLGTDGMAISPNEKIFIVSTFNPNKKKYDLYISRKIAGSTWSYPELLDIPNAANEISVYIAGDNKTVYFASDRSGGMGGYDIYKTTLTEGAQCTPPVNLGAPYNSTRDDYGFVVDPTDDMAYQIIDGDIYQVTLLEEAKPEETLVINGRVEDQNGNPLEARIRLVDLADPSNSIATAKSNKLTGEYSFSFSKKNGKYQQYAATTDNLQGNKQVNVSDNTGKVLNTTIIIDVPVEEPPVEEAVVEDQDEEPSSPVPSEEEAKVIEELNDSDLKEGATLRVDKLFFNADSYDVQSESFETLDDIAAILLQRSEIAKVEIGGHTNGLPSPEYCDRLSSGRAKVIYDYLVRKGVSSTRLVYKGYGKRQPIDTNDTPAGRRNNQRVEIKILELR
ncbi:MAG: OmpA family protein [Bacteroidota bacterium]